MIFFKHTDFRVIEKSDNTTKKEIDKKINEFLLLICRLILNLWNLNL